MKVNDELFDFIAAARDLIPDGETIRSIEADSGANALFTQRFGRPDTLELTLYPIDVRITTIKATDTCLTEKQYCLAQDESELKLLQISEDRSFG